MCVNPDVRKRSIVSVAAFKLKTDGFGVLDNFASLGRCQLSPFRFLLTLGVFSGFGRVPSYKANTLALGFVSVTIYNANG